MKQIEEIRETLRQSKAAPAKDLKMGEIIKKFRQEKNVSQLHLGLAIGSTAAYISQLETNRKTPTVVTIDKIMTALDIDTIKFFETLFPKK